MLRRWKKAMFLSIAVVVRSAVVPMARFSDRMRAKADALLPAFAIIVMLGGLMAANYAVSHTVVVAGR